MPDPLLRDPPLQVCWLSFVVFLLVSAASFYSFDFPWRACGCYVFQNQQPTDLGGFCGRLCHADVVPAEELRQDVRGCCVDRALVNHPAQEIPFLLAAPNQQRCAKFVPKVAVSHVQGVLQDSHLVKLCQLRAASVKALTCKGLVVVQQNTFEHVPWKVMKLVRLDLAMAICLCAHGAVKGRTDVWNQGRGLLVCMDDRVAPSSPSAFRRHVPFVFPSRGSWAFEPKGSRRQAHSLGCSTNTINAHVAAFLDVCSAC